MDIEEFYDADERRRQSAEVEFGRDWFDASGLRYELSWVESTGELYAMLEVTPGLEEFTPFGDETVEKLPDSAVVVRVLGTIPSRDEVEKVLDGWAGHMSDANGYEWVVERLRSAGIAPPAEN